MKLTDESRAATNMVRSYSPGEVRIGEASYTRSCVLAAQSIVTDWPPQSIDELQPEHLDTVFALQPELLILGTGPQQRFPSPVLISKVLARGVGLEVMDTGAACRTFNILIAEDRRAVAALFW
ncbi:MAG: Mth938-like domain-containing protein [Steroidobacteraceae bacterium]